jgi:peptidoglycan-associated lipoprotein
MRALLIPLLLIAGTAQAQILQRVLPGRAPPAPLVMGIDALRADFIARTGSDKVYFGGDSVGLTAQTTATLAAQAAWLRQHPEVVVRIEGHADPSDTRDHALAVGARRAEEVRNYLILMGVPGAQLTTLSWGKERVAVQGSSVEALALNRRAVTVLVR